MARLLHIFEVLMVCMTVVAKIKPGKEIEFKQAVSHVEAVEETRPGGGSVTTSAFCTLVLEWEDELAFYRYMHTDGMDFLRGALAVLCEEAQFSITPRSQEHVRIEDHLNGRRLSSQDIRWNEGQ